MARLLTEEKIRLYASHLQFYIQDSKPRGTPGDLNFWTQEASENRLALTDGLIGVSTGTYDFVTVRVEEYDSKPPIDLGKWDHVTECGLDIKTGLMLIKGCLSESGLFFEVKPGHYRVRCCHANLAESEQEAPSDWTGDFKDWYFIQFWSAKPSRPRVVKRHPHPT